MMSGIYNYNYWLVALFFGAVFMSYAAIALVERGIANHGSVGRARLIGCAIAMGSGIWCGPTDSDGQPGLRGE